MYAQMKADISTTLQKVLFDSSHWSRVRYYLLLKWGRCSGKMVNAFIDKLLFALELPGIPTHKTDNMLLAMKPIEAVAYVE